MQNYCKTIGALAAASALVAGNATAEVEYELHGGYTSTYLFRGIEQGEDLVEVGFDVGTVYNDVALSAGVWHGTYEQGPVNETELDLYGEAAYDVGFATASVGYIAYLYDVANDTDAQEVFFGLSRDLGFAEASLAYFWEIEGDNEGYAELGLSRSFELSPCLSLGLSTALGYAFENSDFCNWMTTASLDWAVAENTTVSPFVTVSVEGSENATYESDNETELIGGTMLSVSF